MALDGAPLSPTFFSFNVFLVGVFLLKGEEEKIGVFYDLWKHTNMREEEREKGKGGGGKNNRMV